MEEKEGKETGGMGRNMEKRLRVAEVLFINDSLYPVLVWRRNGSAKTAIGQSGRVDKVRRNREGKMEPFLLWLASRGKKTGDYFGGVVTQISLLYFFHRRVGSRDLDGFFP